MWYQVENHLQCVLPLPFGFTDDRPSPPVFLVPPVPLPPPMEKPPKRPDKSLKPKLPPRPLTKEFSCSEHGGAILQVQAVHGDSEPGWNNVYAARKGHALSVKCSCL